MDTSAKLIMKANVKTPIALDLSYVDNESHRVNSYLREAVERWLKKWCRDNDYNPYEYGLKIYTTIDPRLQRYAEEAVAEKMKMLQKRFNDFWGKIEIHGMTWTVMKLKTLC